MMMKLNYHTLLYIGLLPLLAACSTHDDGEGLASYEGFPQEVNLSAATITTTTRSRATSDNAEVWAGNERIAVHMEVDNPVENAGFTKATYPYIPSPTGELTAEDKKNMFYFRSPNDPARTCDAWYWPSAKDASGQIGYSEESPVNKAISVPTDQSNTAHAANDLLYAPPTAIKYNSKNPNMVYSLLFCHQLTWVSFQVVADNSSSYDKSDLSATMGTKTEPLIYQAKFSAPSGQTTSSGSREVFGAYSSTEEGVKSGVITPHQLVTPDVDGIICRYEAVLIPQTLSADGKTTHNLFNITLGGKTYRYNSTMDLKAGVHYTFNLKIAKGDDQLIVLATNANLWKGREYTGTTGSGNGWDTKDESGTTGSGTGWSEDDPSGTTGSGENWGDKEHNGTDVGTDTSWSEDDPSGTTGSGTGWGDKEDGTGGTTGSATGWGTNESGGVTGTALGWKDKENSEIGFIDINSWKKDGTTNIGVSSGSDWRKEGETKKY